MNRLVYLSPIVLALGMVACQKREATDTSTPPATPSTTAPGGMSPGAGVSGDPASVPPSASAPSMSGSGPMAPSTGASQ